MDFLQASHLGFVFGCHLLLAAALSARGEAHPLLLRDVPPVAEIVGINETVDVIIGIKELPSHRLLAWKP